MTAQLVSPIDPSTSTDPSIYNVFFDADDQDKISKFVSKHECPDHTAFPPPCTVNLFFGFFFDGTNNNLKRDRPAHSHSNVARLYSAFPGGRDDHDSEAWPHLTRDYYHFFRTYIPGVGTPFDKVGDSGQGSTRTKGLAFAYLGANRIVWALVEAINNVHKYFLDRPLIDVVQFQSRFNYLPLPSFADTDERFARPNEDERPTPYSSFKETFVTALTELHQALAMFLPSDAPKKSKDKGVVTALYFSLFGFSRGAAEARAFANWFVWLCRLDADIAGRAAASLGTIPVTFDFMGLFDTVASVGLASSVPLLGANGHYAWADTGHSLAIPGPGIGPAHCLHLVSAHEIRRSFPLDSVAVKGHLPANCQEIVCPGVHSDIGGGYRPKEQGRGTDAQGADLLSRITLATMYRAARLAGVPLKLEEAPEAVKLAFRIDADLIRGFNAYLHWCTRPGTPRTAQAGALHEVMAQQHKLYIQWRKKMVGKMEQLASFKASDLHDEADIQNADQELAYEIAQFEKWRNWSDSGDDRGKPYSWPEWSAIAGYWDEPAPPAQSTDLFERYVHDSRAWFKPFGDDVPDLQAKLEQLSKREEALIKWEKCPVGPAPQPLSAVEKARLVKYLPYRGKGNVREGIEPESHGREPYAMGGGFLRYRKIYMRSDGFKPAGAVYASLKPKNNPAAPLPLKPQLDMA